MQTKIEWSKKQLQAIMSIKILWSDSPLNTKMSFKTTELPDDVTGVCWQGSVLDKKKYPVVTHKTPLMPPFHQ